MAFCLKIANDAVGSLAYPKGGPRRVRNHDVHSARPDARPLGGGGRTGLRTAGEEVREGRTKEEKDHRTPTRTLLPKSLNFAPNLQSNKATPQARPAGLQSLHHSADNSRDESWAVAHGECHDPRRSVPRFRYVRSVFLPVNVVVFARTGS